MKDKKPYPDRLVGHALYMIGGGVAVSGLGAALFPEAAVKAYNFLSNVAPDNFSSITFGIISDRISELEESILNNRNSGVDGGNLQLKMAQYAYGGISGALLALISPLTAYITHRRNDDSTQNGGFQSPDPGVSGIFD